MVQTYTYAPLELAAWLVFAWAWLWLLRQLEWGTTGRIAGWRPGRWQLLAFAAVFGGLAVWPIWVPLRLAIQAWLLTLASGDPAVSRVVSSWATAAHLVGLTAGYAIGALVAHDIVGKLAERCDSYPEWARRGWARAAIFLALSGALAAGIVAAVDLAIGIARGAQLALAPGADAGVGATTVWARPWLVVGLQLLGLAAYLVADRVESALDMGALERSIGWVPSPRQVRLFSLTLAAWLMWPFELPYNFYTRWPGLGLDTADALRFALAMLAAVTLAWLFIRYRLQSAD